MPLFFFDLVDGRTIADAGGQPCRDLAEAQEIADGLAIRLAKSRPELIGGDYGIAVKTSEDQEVYRARIDVLHKQLLSH